jgi:DNA-directed RNA polymerase sigma subunit (sigma70/sigma32)
MRRPEVVLETELLDLLETGRNARITSRRYGFDGRVAKSLQSVGNAFGHP